MAKVKAKDPKQTFSNPTLDSILTALQKSFSRVTEQTQNNEGKTAQMVGDVNFELKTKLKAEGDSLTYSQDGEIEITFSGVIDLDIDED